MRNRRQSGLLAGQRAVANIATGCERQVQKTRPEAARRGTADDNPRPGDRRPLGARWHRA